jgi:hypothetical protein
MKSHRLLLCVPLIALFCALHSMAHQQTEKLGQVHFAVSCSPAAQSQFDRAVALLHSFWYSEAVKAFTAVTATDPDCAMGHWGIAMSLWYPLWQPPSAAMLKQGAEAVTQAKASGGMTAREREYYDYPSLASHGLTAARRYAQIAPSSPHALHMPSHVFTRLGLWQESIATNRDLAAAAKEHNSVFEQLHALDYLAYAYLQGVQDVQAQRVLDERNALAQADLENFAAAYAFAAIPARYTLERRRWAEAAALQPHPGKLKYTEAVTYFARAIGAARSGNAAQARADGATLQSLSAALREAKQPYWAEQVNIQRRVAEAWSAQAAERHEEALTLMRAAVELEDTTEKHPVMPGPIMPARELLGELLLELNDPVHALQEFETSTLKEPNRLNGLYGVARAAELAGEKEKAKGYYAKLVALCEHSDTARPALQQARAFLGQQ